MEHWDEDKVADWVKTELRKTRGKERRSQEAQADEYDVSESTYKRWESGQIQKFTVLEFVKMLAHIESGSASTLDQGVKDEAVCYKSAFSRLKSFVDTLRRGGE